MRSGFIVNCYQNGSCVGLSGLVGSTDKGFVYGKADVNLGDGLL